MERQILDIQVGCLALPEFPGGKMDEVDQGAKADDAFVEPLDLSYPETESPRDFAQRTGLLFTDFLLLSRALTHRSYLNEHSEALEDNERLEFLGDAVLDFLVGAWLYNHFPWMAEGELTRLRSALVRTEQLADFARKLKVGQAMRLGRGEAEGGGRNRTILLCGMFEAIIGALYLNTDIQVVKDFIQPLLSVATDDILTNRQDQDPKSLLQEWVQSQGHGTPIYMTVSTTGPEHNKRFEIEVLVDGEVYGRAWGHSKQAAAKAAARNALELLGVG
jgi:ribonuclease-3